jgi:hypothetical protein
VIRALRPEAIDRLAVLGVTSRQENLEIGTITTTGGTKIFYKDWGSGQPIAFSHGWPLSADDWGTQMLFFLGPRIPRRHP